MLTTKALIHQYSKWEEQMKTAIFCIPHSVKKTLPTISNKRESEAKMGGSCTVTKTGVSKIRQGGKLSYMSYVKEINILVLILYP